MISPIAGNLIRTVPTYPLPGYTTDDLFSTGAPLIDDTGDVFYFAAYFTTGAPAGNVALFKYVFSTDTMSKIADISLAASGNTSTSLLWNSARDAILAYMASGQDTQVWSITIPGAVVTDLGLLTGVNFTTIASDGSTYVGKDLVGKAFYAIDFGAMTSALLVTLTKYCQPITMNDRFIFTTTADSIQQPGPLISLDRETGFLMKFLTGSKAGAGVMAPVNPKYMTCAFGLYSAYVVQNLVYMYATIDSNPLVAYDLDTGITYKITDDFLCPTVFPAFVVTPDGSKVFSIYNFSSLYVYN